MRRIAIGVLLLGFTAAAVAATATGSVSELRTEWQLRGYLAEDERAALAACEDPGGLALSRVVSQNMRVDCAPEALFRWLHEHSADPLLKRVLSASNPHPRHELRRAGLAYLAGDSLPLSLALEHPDLPVETHAKVVSWLAGTEVDAEWHPRTAERLSVARLDRDGWVPQPHVALRALRDDGDGDGRARAEVLGRELGELISCVDDCHAAVVSALERVALHDPVEAPTLFGTMTEGARVGDAAERLDEAVRWVRVHPSGLHRVSRVGPGTTPDAALLGGGSTALAAWTLFEVADRAGLTPVATRTDAGIEVHASGEVHPFAVCAGEGPVVAADIAELVWRAETPDVVGIDAPSAAARLIRGLALPARGLCDPT